MTRTKTNSIDSSLAQRIRDIRLIAFDFDGVFTDNMVYVFEDGSEAVRCFRGDGMGLRKLEGLGITPVIISSESNPVVSVRGKKLAVRCIQGCANKKEALQVLIEEMGISLQQVAFVGNDVNDLSCLTSVGLPIVVRDAHSDVIPVARYQTQARGGHGAVREICDLFERFLKGTQSVQEGIQTVSVGESQQTVPFLGKDTVFSSVEKETDPSASSGQALLKK